MEIIKLRRDHLQEIEPLWCELNAHHLKKSNNFHEHFASFTFAERLKKLLVREKLMIFAARENRELVGYCIASVNAGDGEIDSLYIKPQFRGTSLGQMLTEAALTWLSNVNCRRISVHVADGNEEALSFYEKFGFKKRYYVMQIQNREPLVPE